MPCETAEQPPAGVASPPQGLIASSSRNKARVSTFQRDGVSLIHLRNVFRIGTLNVRTLSNPFRKSELVRLASSIGVDVLGVQEHRIQGRPDSLEQTDISDGWLLVSSSANKKGSAGGVGFLLSPTLSKCMVSQASVSERIIAIRLDCHPRPNQLELICIYAPTATPKRALETELFYSLLSSHLGALPPHVTPIILGDFNATLLNGTAGCLFGPSSILPNLNSDSFASFLIGHGFKPVNRLFQKRARSLNTFAGVRPPDPTGRKLVRRACLDYICVPTRHLKAVSDISIYNSRIYQTVGGTGRGSLVGFPSDHRMVVANFAIRPRCPKRARERLLRPTLPEADRIGDRWDPALTAAYDGQLASQLTLHPYVVDPSETTVARGLGQPDPRYKHLLGAIQAALAAAVVEVDRPRRIAVSPSDAPLSLPAGSAGDAIENKPFGERSLSPAAKRRAFGPRLAVPPVPPPPPDPPPAPPPDPPRDPLHPFIGSASPHSSSVLLEETVNCFVPLRSAAGCHSHSAIAQLHLTSKRHARNPLSASASVEAARATGDDATLRSAYDAVAADRMRLYDVITSQVTSDDFHGHPRAAWRLIKAVASLDAPRAQVTSLPPPDAFRTHFANYLSSPDPAKTSEDLLGKLDALIGSDPLYKEKVPVITADETCRALRSMASHKSPGSDGIPVQLLRRQVLLPHITDLLNCVLLSEELPVQWKETILIPIHKKGDTTVADNYRGIALMQSLLKLYNKVLLGRIRKQIDVSAPPLPDPSDSDFEDAPRRRKVPAGASAAYRAAAQPVARTPSFVALP